MKIRDLHATLNGNKEITELPSGGLEIIADDGRPLFSIRLQDNVLYVSSGMVCKHNGVMLDDSFVISPRAANCVDLVKVEYKP